MQRSLIDIQARNAISQLSETELMGRPILVREDRGDTGNHGRGVGGAAGAKVRCGFSRCLSLCQLV